MNAGQNNIEHFGGGGAGAGGGLDPDILKTLLDNRASITPTLIQGLAQMRVLDNPSYFIHNQRMRLFTPPDMWEVIRGSLEHPERLMYYGEATRVRGMEERKARFKELWFSGVRVNVAGARSTTRCRSGTSSLSSFVVPGSSSSAAERSGAASSR